LNCSYKWVVWFVMPGYEVRLIVVAIIVGSMSC
jgi:hypothetical protein